MTSLSSEIDELIKDVAASNDLVRAKASKKPAEHEFESQSKFIYWDDDEDDDESCAPPSPIKRVKEKPTKPIAKKDMALLMSPGARKLGKTPTPNSELTPVSKKRRIQPLVLSSAPRKKMKLRDDDFTGIATSTQKEAEIVVAASEGMSNGDDERSDKVENDSPLKTEMSKAKRLAAMVR